MPAIPFPTNKLQYYDYVSDRHNDDQFMTLKEDISKNGVTKPITVTLVNGEYEVVDGFHRLLACQCLGKTTIPVQVINLYGKKYNKLTKQVYYGLDINTNKLLEHLYFESSVYKKIMTFKEIMCITANQKVLAHITGFSEMSVSCVCMILNLSQDTLDMLKDPFYEEVFTIARLSELAKKKMSKEIQITVMKRLFDVSINLGWDSIIPILRRTSNPLTLDNLETAIVEVRDLKTTSVRTAIEKALEIHKENLHKLVDETIQKLSKETVQKLSEKTFLRKPGTGNETYIMPSDLTVEEYDEIIEFIRTKTYCPPEKCADCPICMLSGARNVKHCITCKAAMCPNCFEKLSTSHADFSCPFCRGAFV